MAAFVLVLFLVTLGLLVSHVQLCFRVGEIERGLSDLECDCEEEEIAGEVAGE
jgi:hypothetical protein